ncbi:MULTISPECIES: MutS-related protein [Thermotoga]|jgi:DNA mismatch repair ATPase MutS|uniref:DNA mismatch repair protein MutS domain protein n=4 Tax=Thermotoga petrophila TaxID=93929 RepID=A5INL3_THEP1|nr:MULTISPECIES: DNA mismatch repair protein MutS [Thermotoga]KUK33182.1 MAG: DNA mismatch repair protein MutS domain protein [Thermotoga sp. 47_83]ABQ47786.1 DNA mismatch repair protein MutS domain protein [Thermotoga petrophila RKU-1]ADA67847.1 DNA mismatch repair protein MutS domain protein [Thermotoga petrophila RKU-10]AIY89037.1 DNA mismatch repair protein MutS domain protein [Thermotoga sp. Cell2]KHC93206.1 DNA mismatch repair protein MutS domain protein [Thermotoga sp. TBGT1765]
MRVLLMYPDKDFNLKRELPFNADDLTRDLGLDVIFDHMAKGDGYLYSVVRNVILNPETDLETIKYRQEILKDCMKNQNVVRRLFQIPLEVQENKKKNWWGVFGWKTPINVLNGSRKALEAMLVALRELKKLADEHRHNFHSRGFTRFFEMIRTELDEAYLQTVEKHLINLRFSNGMLFKVKLGKGNEGKDYTLCQPDSSRSILKRLLSVRRMYSYKLHPRDESGARALEKLTNLGLRRVAATVYYAAEHVEKFLNKIREELAFYIGCLNLLEDVEKSKISFPDPKPIDEDDVTAFRGLYDLSLLLIKRNRVISNDLNTRGKRVFFIMGANRGGKTTFLRSIGQAQLMMQAGMFVPASYFESNVCKGIFTHFKREEDPSLKRGKFEEELVRMNEIVLHLHRRSMVLFNESFSSTNEMEGSEVAYQIVRALLDSRVKVFYVTHVYELARRFTGDERVMFLQAERKPTGERTFKIKEGLPSQTSHAKDIYLKVFRSSTSTSPSS